MLDWYPAPQTKMHASNFPKQLQASRLCPSGWPGLVCRDTRPGRKMKEPLRDWSGFSFFRRINRRLVSPSESFGWVGMVLCQGSRTSVKASPTAAGRKAGWRQQEGPETLQVTFPDELRKDRASCHIAKTGRVPRL